MKLKPNIVTLKRCTAAFLCLSMVFSIVNITRIGLAETTHLKADEDICMFQSVGTGNVSPDTVAVKVGDPLIYTVQGRVHFEEQGQKPNPSEDTGGESTQAMFASQVAYSSPISGSQIGNLFSAGTEDETGNTSDNSNSISIGTNESDSIVETDVESGSEDKLDTTPNATTTETGNPENTGNENTDGAEDPKEDPKNEPKTDPVTAVFDVTLPSSLTYSDQNIEITAVEEDSANAVYEIPTKKPVKSATGLTVTCDGIAKSCVITVKISGTVASDVTAGSIMEASSSFKVGNANATQSNKLSAVVPVEVLPAQKITVAVKDSTKYDVSKLSYSVTKSVNNSASKPVVSAFGSNGESMLSSETCTEEGTYKYVIKHESSTDTNLIVDSSYYEIIRTVSKGGSSLQAGVVSIKHYDSTGKELSTVTSNVLAFEDTLKKTPSTPDDPKDPQKPDDTTKKPVKTTIGGLILAKEGAVKENAFKFTIEGISMQLDKTKESTATQSIENSTVAPAMDQVPEYTAPMENVTQDSNQTISTPVDTSASISASADSTTPNQSLDSAVEGGLELMQDLPTDTEDRDMEEPVASDVSTDIVENTDDGEEITDLTPEKDKDILASEDPEPMASSTAVKDMPMPQYQTVHNNADGSFSFGEVSYDAAGLYTYKITQTDAATGKVIDSYQSRIKVPAETDGTLGAAVVSYASADGTNTSPNLIIRAEATTEPPKDTTTPKMKLNVRHSVNGGTYTTEAIKVKSGDEINYSMTISNEGDALAKDVVIEFPIPAGLKYKSGTASQTPTQTLDDKLVWKVTSAGMNPNTNVTITFTLSVPTASVANKWTINPTITYKKDGSNETLSTDKIDLVIENTAIENPGDVSRTGLQLTLTQARNNDAATTNGITVYAGDTIKYTVIVANRSDSAIQNIDVSDIVPDGLTVDNNSISSNGVLRNYSILWTIDKLEPGASVTFSFNARVNEIRSSVDLRNSVSAYPRADLSAVAASNVTIANGYAATTYNDVAITMLQSFDSLRNATDRDLQVKSGDLVYYYITVQNTGNSASQRIIVKDEVPSGMEIDARSISNNGSVNRGVLTWEVETIPSRSSVTLSFAAKIPTTGNMWDNSATVYLGDTTSRGINSNTVRASLTSSGLTISQTQAVNSGTSGINAVTVTKGDVITYSFTVTNATGRDVSNVIIDDIIPSGLVVNINSLTTGGTVNGNNVTWNIGTLPANSRYTVGVRATVGESTNGTSWRNVGTVTYNQNERATSNEVVANYTIANINQNQNQQNPNQNQQDQNQNNQNQNNQNQNNQQTGNATGGMGQPLDGSGTGTGGTGTAGTSNNPLGTATEGTNYNPNVDSDLFKVGGKIPQTGGFTEMHLYMFILVVSGGGLVLLALTGKKQKRAW